MFALALPVRDRLALSTSEDSTRPPCACQIAFRLFSLSFSALRPRFAASPVSTNSPQAFAPQPCRHYLSLALDTSEDSTRAPCACQIRLCLFSLSFPTQRHRSGFHIRVNSHQRLPAHQLDFRQPWRWAQATILSDPHSLVKSVCAYFHYRF